MVIDVKQLGGTAVQDTPDPLFAPGDEEERKKKRLEEHSPQSEKLLSKPIVIPRNPWALIVHVIAIVFLADIVTAVLIFSASVLSNLSVATLVLVVGSLVVLKTFLLGAVIIKMSLDWVPDSYEITERELIKKKGIATKEDKVYELSNIRHVSVHQNFVGRQLEYGDVELLVATAGLNETIRLQDIKDPHHFEEVFTAYMG